MRWTVVGACVHVRCINPRSDVRKWRALPWVDAPVFDLGSRPDEPPISPSTLGRQRAPSGLGQIGGSSSLCPGRILTCATTGTSVPLLARPRGRASRPPELAATTPMEERPASRRASRWAASETTRPRTVRNPRDRRRGSTPRARAGRGGERLWMSWWGRGARRGGGGGRMRRGEARRGEARRCDYGLSVTHKLEQQGVPARGAAGALSRSVCSP